MLSNILKLNGVVQLDRAQQKSITGGAGNCAVKCKSGALIENAPNMSDEVMDFACANQGGASWAICTGEETPWDNPRG